MTQSIRRTIWRREKPGNPNYAFMATATLCSLLYSPTFAATGEDIVLKGAPSVPACATCHGQNGEGQPDAGFPRLAGLDPTYLEQQINSFANGTRANDIMKPIATALSPEDRKAVIDYLSAKTPPKAMAAEQPDEKLVAQGRVIATDGLWSKGVPGCNQCHGPNGQGVGHTFPRLAGQSVAYVDSQLKAWQAGTRSNDPLALMKGIASKLDDNEVAAVSAYYASLDPFQSADQTNTDGKGAGK